MHAMPPTPAPAPVDDLTPEPRLFHAVLGSVFVPFLGLLFSWGVLRTTWSRTAKPWRRALFALVSIDTLFYAYLVGGMLGWVSLDSGEMESRAEPSAESTPGFFEAFPAQSPSIDTVLLGAAWLAPCLFALLVLLWGAPRRAWRQVGWPLLLLAGPVVVVLGLDDALSAMGLFSEAAGHGTSITEGLIFSAVALCLLRRPEGAFRPATWTRRVPAATAIPLGLFYMLTFGARAGGLEVVLDQLLPSPGSFGVVPSDSSEGSGPWATVVVVLSTVVVAPITEELTFRGVLLGWFRTWRSDAYAIGASSLLFALVHLHYGFGMLLVLSHGAVFGWVRLRTGGLLAPIALHMLINGASLFLLSS